MATLRGEEIPVFYDYDQAGLRLLELPQEVLESIQAGDSKLRFKSAEKSPSNPIKDSEDHAVLCTSDRTFKLRQIQSSNTLFLMRPHTPQLDQALPRTALSMFATCTGSLELQPVGNVTEGKPESAKHHLERLTTEIRNGYDFEQPTMFNGWNRGDIFRAIPYSEREIQAAWDELVVFEHAGSTFRLSNFQLLSAWSGLIEATASNDIDICSTFSVIDAAEAAANECYPRSLFEAILRPLSAHDGTTSRDMISINRQHAVNWVGELNLQNHGADSPGMLTECWRISLPKEWRQDACEAKLEALRLQRGRRADGLGKKPVPANGSAANQKVDKKRPGARDWHEKFKRTRN